MAVSIDSSRSKVRTLETNGRSISNCFDAAAGVTLSGVTGLDCVGTEGVSFA